MPWPRLIYTAWSGAINAIRSISGFRNGWKKNADKKKLPYKTIFSVSSPYVVQANGLTRTEPHGQKAERIVLYQKRVVSPAFSPFDFRFSERNVATVFRCWAKHVNNNFFFFYTPKIKNRTNRTCRSFGFSRKITIVYNPFAHLFECFEWRTTLVMDNFTVLSLLIILREE